VNFHLAQVNVAWMHGAIDEPAMSGLAGRIEELNTLAEQSEGFVWRIPTSDVTFEALEPFNADFPGFRRDRLFYNMSVWKSLEDLRAYTFGSLHAEMLNDRRQWVERVEGAAVALWWIPIGTRPTIEESAERLRSVRNLGATAYAFTMRKPFPPSCG
jgi:hypothetical protein